MCIFCLRLPPFLSKTQKPARFMYHNSFSGSQHFQFEDISPAAQYCSSTKSSKPLPCLIWESD